MPSNSLQQCDGCGRVLRKGQTRYLVTINVVADFDGTLGSPPSGGELERIWKEVDQKSEEELTAEVYQKLSYTLCKPCRDRWTASPLGELSMGDVPRAGHYH